MISGTTNDSSIVKFADPRRAAVPPVDPIANNVPNGTVINTVMIARRYVCTIAVRIASSCRIESVGSWVHQRSENPCHEIRERPSLNENATAIRTGSNDHSR